MPVELRFDYKPQAVTYRTRGYAWDYLDPALPKFDKMASG
jgi:hypothetical protein